MAFDARWWNLGMGALVAATTGCGPSIQLDDVGNDDSGNSDGTDGSADAGDDDNGDAPDDNGDGPDGPEPPECTEDADCPSSEYVCSADGTCEFDDYGYDDYDDYCSRNECNECQIDEDCGIGEICEEGYNNECEPLEPLGDCAPGDAPTLTELPIELTGDAEVVSLSFVDANGDALDDLLIGRSEGATLLLGPGDGPTIPLPALDDSVVLDAASADLDGDGDLDLVIAAAEDGVVVLLSDGAGGYAPSPPWDYEAAGIASVVTLDFDDDGAQDVAFGGANSMTVLRGDGTGGIAQAIPLHDGAADDVAVVASDTVSVGLVAGTSSGVRFWHGGPNGDDELLLPAPHAGPWRVATPGGHADAVLGFAAVANWTMVGSAASEEVWAMHRLVDDATAGDFDGDGTEDVVLGSGSLVVFLRGTGGAPGCEQVYGFSDPVDHLALGDLDGDGTPELARASGSAVTLHQTE